MPASITNHVRDALLTVALFGGIGVALAQSPAQNSGNIESAQSPKVPGRTRSSFSRISLESPGIVFRAKSSGIRRSSALFIRSICLSCCAMYPAYFTSVSTVSKTPRAGASPGRS